MTGLGAVPAMPMATVVLAATGAIVAIVRRSGPLPFFAIATALLMPPASVATNDSALHRSMIIAACISLLAALAVVEIVRGALGRDRLWRISGSAMAVLLILYICHANLDGYFRQTAESGEMRAVMSEDLVLAMEYVESIPGDPYVYLYSDRWPFEHEIVRYLGHNPAGESRGRTFGIDSLEINVDMDQHVVILMRGYQNQLDALQTLYPGGEVVKSAASSGDPLRPAFIAYLLPERASLSPMPRVSARVSAARPEVRSSK